MAILDVAYLIFLVSYGLTLSLAQSPLHQPLLGVESSPDDCSKDCDYYDWAQDAYCGDRNLTHVPSACRRAVLLDMRNNNMHNITAGALEGFSDLKYVDFSANKIRRIDNGALNGAPHLEHIYLFDNQMTYLNYSTFIGLSYLKQIYLSNNSLTSITSTAFSSLRKLSVLYLNKNKLSSLSVGLFSNTFNLEFLHLSGNSISSLNQYLLKSLNKLVLLDLSSNKLEAIPGNFFRYSKSLRTVKLANNRLVSADFVTSFTNIQYIDLRNNQIRNVSSLTTIVHKETFIQLDLGENPLQCDCSIEGIRRFYLSHPGMDSAENQVKCSDGRPLIEYIDLCEEEVEPEQTPEKVPPKALYQFSDEEEICEDKMISYIMIACIVAVCLCSLLVCVGCGCYLYYYCCSVKEYTMVATAQEYKIKHSTPQNDYYFAEKV